MIYDFMSTNGQAAKQVWVTEWGWPTDNMSESLQAQYVDKSLQMIKTLYPFVTIAIYFLDYDRAPKYYHGLYTNDFRLKEAGRGFKTFVDKSRFLRAPRNLGVINELGNVHCPLYLLFWAGSSQPSKVTDYKALSARSRFSLDRYRCSKSKPLESES